MGTGILRVFAAGLSGVDVGDPDVSREIDATVEPVRREEWIHCGECLAVNIPLAGAVLVVFLQVSSQRRDLAVVGLRANVLRRPNVAHAG